VGDVICRYRTTPNNPSKTHCDIVISISGTSVTSIGGNVNDTAKIRAPYKLLNSTLVTHRGASGAEYP